MTSQDPASSSLNKSQQSKTFNFKLVLLGDSSVGKTSCVERFVRDQFLGNQTPTIGASFLTQTVALEDGLTVKFQIWDTAGQERYRSLAPMYYRGAIASLVVFDITNEVSFKGAKDWIDELQKQGSPNIVIGLAGNKLDMAHNRKIQNSEAMKFANDNNLIYFETSAKTGENVREIFLEIARKIPKNSLGGQDPGLVDMYEEKPKSSCC